MTLCERLAMEEAESLPLAMRREFDAMVAGGAKPQFALACILQEAPGGKGNFTPKFHSTGGSVNDQAFTRSAWHRMNNMNPRNREKMLAIAKRAGINTNGKAYVGALGKYDNPLAWCSTGDDALQSAKIQGKALSGAVNCSAPDAPPVRGAPLAPDIVRREARKLLAKDERLAHQVATGKVKKQDIAERVIAKHGKKRLVFNGS